MFFVLSKIVGFFAVPSNLFVLIGLAGIALLPSRFARTGRYLLVASVGLMLAIGVLPIGNALILPLEERFPQWDPAHGAPSGIIVLGGVINPTRSVARHQVSLGEAAERITSAVALARQYPTARIVFSGGNGQLTSGPPESDFAVRLFEDLGVPRGRITLETQSRNTAENAAYTKQPGRPQARRALGADYFCHAYAEGGRFVSSGRFSSRGLSGRLSNIRLARLMGAARFADGRHSRNRCGGPRMAGLIHLLGERADSDAFPKPMRREGN